MVNQAFTDNDRDAPGTLRLLVTQAGPERLRSRPARIDDDES
jgi:hypothetical protein